MKLSNVNRRTSGFQNCEVSNPVTFFPTGPFTILEPDDQEIIEFCLVQERRTFLKL